MNRTSAQLILVRLPATDPISFTPEQKYIDLKDGHARATGRDDFEAIPPVVQSVNVLTRAMTDTINATKLRP